MSTNEFINIETGQVPTVTLKLLTGNQEEGGRSAGVFTADDLIKLLLYVRSARKLPQTEAALVKDLGSPSTGIAHLEPIDIVTLYNQVTDHANRWTPVENQVKEQASSLTVASKAIVTIGGRVIELINKMDVMEQLDTVTDSTATIPIDSAQDKKIQTALPTVIAKLRRTCEEEQLKTRKVLDAVRDYKTEISGGLLSSGTQVTGLEPAVADKKEKAKNADLGGSITALQQEIDSLDQRIDQLKKDYSKYVGLAFTGAFGGPIGLAITGGIFGAKAEAARKERNGEIDKKNQKSVELERKQKVQGALNVFSSQFTDLGMRLLDAEQALEHLGFLWGDMVERIDKSVEQWKEVNDSAMLTAFVTDLDIIVNPWKEVGDMSTQLSKVFDRAYDEFRKTYGA
jgi:hypothetical protein